MKPEAARVIDLEPRRGAGVGSSGGGRLGARVEMLETRMTTVEENTAEILAIVSGAKTVGGYIRKYGSKTIVFGAGLMTAFGVGNPAVTKFISSFFGG